MLTVQIIAKILQTVMNLEDGQIWVFNQRREVPKGKGLYVVVGMVDVKPYGVNVTNMGTTDEVRKVHMRESISIDVFSYDMSAVQRLPELIGALNSTVSAQYQESYGFKLATVPVSCPNTSDVEGPSMINRFTVTTVALRAYDNTSPIEYYDQFSFETITEEGEVT